MITKSVLVAPLVSIYIKTGVTLIVLLVCNLTMNQVCVLNAKLKTVNNVMTDIAKIVNKVLKFTTLILVLFLLVDVKKVLGITKDNV